MTLSRWIALPTLCLITAPSAFAACKIGTIAEIPVSIVGNRALIDAQINGQDAKVLVDTGGVLTLLWEEEAVRLGLPLQTGTRERLFGIGGEARVFGTVITQFQMGSFTDNYLHLAVVGRALGGRPRIHGSTMILGEDFFSNFTTEFDFAHGVIRLLRPEGCQPDQLTYWSDTYSLAELERINPEHARLRTNVLVNGRRISAMLDTGATTSMIARETAEGMGVVPGSAGTVAAGAIAGAAAKPVESWIGTFASFSIGDESMRNVKLRIADLFTADTTETTGSHIRQPIGNHPDLLIGCDFFLSHRILVLAKEHTLLFTYNGGPVFQLVKSSTAPKEGSDHPARVAAPPAPAAKP
jgi:predicted aspartyl protease